MPVTTVPAFPLRSQGKTQAQYSSEFEASMTALPLAIADLNAVGSAYALATNATSSTSNTIGTGSKSFTTQTNLGYQIGQSLRIANSSTNFMTGEVTSYNVGTGALVMNISSVVGTGTFTSWFISQSATGASTAAAVSNTPAGNISATTVQAAINELDTEKLSSAAGAVTGTNLEDITTAETVGSSYVIPIITKDVNGRITSAASAQKITASSPVATTSGTSVTVASSINASVKRVFVSLSGVSINAADNLVFRLNATSSGYGGAGQQTVSTTVSTGNEATGFRITSNNPAGTNAISGIATFVLHDPTNFIYTYSIVASSTTAAAMYYGAGTVTLTGLLTTIAITSLTPSTFDAGSVTTFTE